MVVAELDRRQEGRHKEGSKVACEGTGNKVGTSEVGTCLEGTELIHSMDQEGKRTTSRCYGYAVFCFSLPPPSLLSFSIRVTFDDRADFGQMDHFRQTPLVDLPPAQI